MFIAALVREFEVGYPKHHQFARKNYQNFAIFYIPENGYINLRKRK